MVRQLCQSQEKLQCVFHKQLGCVSKGGPYLLQICTSHLTPALKKGNIQQGQSHHYWNGPDLKSIFSVQKPFCYLSVLTVLVKDLEDSSEITCQRQRFLFKPPLEVGFFLPNQVTKVSASFYKWHIWYENSYLYYRGVTTVIRLHRTKNCTSRSGLSVPKAVYKGEWKCYLGIHISYLQERGEQHETKNTAFIYII